MTDKERLDAIWNIIALEGMLSNDTNLYYKLVKAYAKV